MLQRCIIKWIGILAAVTISDVLANEDEFLLEIKDSCRRGSSTLSCPSYYALSAFTRYLHAPHSPFQKGNINPPTSWIVIQAGPASLVWIKRKQSNDGRLSDSEGGSKFTSTANESSFQQFIHYITHQISDWIEHHAVTISVPNNSNGPRIVLQDGDRIIEADEPTYNTSTLKGKSHRKKKWAVMIPLIALTKFLMLKALLVPIFVATMIIKKIALLGLFYLPPWFASLKICKKEPLVHYHHKSAYDHDEYAAGEYDSTAYQYTGYDRDWSRHHRRSYYPGL